MTITDWIAEMWPDYKMMIMDGYDDCIVGVLERFGQDPCVLYDRDKVLDKLQDEGMTEEESVEWYEYNQLGAWVGPGTPGFVVPIKKEDYDG